jgi:hypothetical protein
VEILASYVLWMQESGMHGHFNCATTKLLDRLYTNLISSTFPS